MAHNPAGQVVQQTKCCCPAGPILDMPEQAIDKILEINVKSAILLCQEVRPHLQRGAAITFISSYTAFNPSNPIPMYAGKYCSPSWPGGLLPP